MGKFIVIVCAALFTTWATFWLFSFMGGVLVLGGVHVSYTIIAFLLACIVFSRMAGK